MSLHRSRPREVLRLLNESSRIVVVKFGGSVLDSESSVDKAAKVVKDSHERGDGVIVVVSAMKGVTDSLLEFSKHSNPSMPPSKLDDLLSLGERASARRFAAALQRGGVEAVIIDPDSKLWPIVTDETHLNANPLIEESRELVRSLIVPLVNEGKVLVVCGFVGRSTTGKITTMGRGGSDTTAIFLGRCLGAKEVVLIKDTEGVFSSDPDKVENPYFVQSLEGDEAERLASGGAKFLQAKSLRFKPEGMRVRITSLDKIESGTVIEGELPDLAARMITVVGSAASRIESIVELTRAVERAHARLLSLSLETNSVILYVAGGRDITEIVHDVVTRKGVGKAVSAFEGLGMLTVYGKGLETTPGLVQRLTQPLARAGINLYGIMTISSSIRVFLQSSQAAAALDMVKKALIAKEEEDEQGEGRT
ncbi:MAG: hypothetical protein E6K86_04610 [Thaumarchaeota archaeon]|nr:MAG: hypothetical protein E6K86_04610 [Nitrososphaerota archaeon]